MTGRLGESVTVEEGQEAARVAGIQLLSTIRYALGDLDRVSKILKLTGFVNSTRDFNKHHLVMNGCSDLIGEAFGREVGTHARSAIGTSILPLDVPVEIEAIVEFKDLPSDK